MRLEELLQRGAHQTPDAIAAVGPDGCVTFAALDAASERVASALATLRVARGDRVGVWLPKSIQALAAFQGTLRVGAAYVPCDSSSPPARVRQVLEDCRVRALVAPPLLAQSLGNDLPPLLAAEPDDALYTDAPVEPNRERDEKPDSDLAYVLYTSGSTGKPKGVCISHRAALAFVEWAAITLHARPEDRFANHAPFHFDLSVLDIYAAWWAGARVVIVPELAAYQPRQLVEMLTRDAISIWYSVPSALALMIDRGGLLEAALPELRAVLFAGEPFPIKYVRALRNTRPSTRLLNLYGPTETNVCTAYEVSRLDDERVDPAPIGTAVCGDRVWAVAADGDELPDGEVGELLVSGPTLMSGYFGGALQGNQPYATGDLVRRLPDGNYEYVGRRDHMVKVHGYRIELGDIEAALLSHPSIREAAVLVTGSNATARLVAFVAGVAAPPALLDVKRHLAERLPRYMIVDELHHVDELPRTRNGKTDRGRLATLAGEAQSKEKSWTPATSKDTSETTS